MVVLLALLLTIAVAALVLWIIDGDADITLLLLSKFGRRSRTLKGKVVWITGASSGIGEHLAYELASIGAHLVLSGTKVEQLRAVEETCTGLASEHNSKVLVVPFDVADFACHEEKVKTVTDFYGRVDVLVNNAARALYGKFPDGAVEDDKTLFDVNVFGPVSLTRLVLKHSAERGGRLHVAVTSSMAALMGSGIAPAYAATKYALQGYFESLRMMGTESMPVDVTVVCPGPVETRLTREAAEILESRRKIRIMSAERCAKLYAVAIANKVTDTWICDNPILLFFYVSQYMPSIFKKYVTKMISWDVKKKNRNLVNRSAPSSYEKSPRKDKQ